MNKFRSVSNIKSISWKIIISSIALIMCILIFMPVASSVDSIYKFPVSIKSNELDLYDIEIIPIEASDHKEYGQKAVEQNKQLFFLLKQVSSLVYSTY